MKNIKIALVHEGANEYMRRTSIRIFDANLLQSSTVGGRIEEAKALYNRMMGIKATQHDYLAEETDEPPTEIREMERSDAAKFQQAQEDKTLTRMANILSAGIAQGMADALQTATEPDDGDIGEQPIKRRVRRARPKL